MPKIALLEIGKSHAETMLSQIIALKNENCNVVLCSDRAFLQQNDYFTEYIDEFHELSIPKSKIGRFKEMRRFSRWLKEQKVNVLIANTAQGKDICNLCIIAPPTVAIVGILHTIKVLDSSFTQRIISRKIKNYFVLNDTLKEYAKPRKGISVRSFYNNDFPYFEPHINKPHGQYWIVIVGGAEHQRRDLEGFIQIASKTPNNVHFYFLGKTAYHIPEVQRFIRRFEETEIVNRIHLFDHFLPNREFYGYLQQADGILPLIHPNTPSAEELLHRQITGVLLLSFGLKIPMLIHEYYQTWEDFHRSAIFYNFSNFKEQFILFQKNRDSIKMQMQNYPRFSAEIQNKQFGEFILSLL